MKNFRIIGIQPPGRINLPFVGTITLADISDEMAESLYRNGCPYLVPTDQHRHEMFPDQKPIRIKELRSTPHKNP